MKKTINKILAIAFNTFKEAIRNKILNSVVIFAVVLMLIAALFSSVSIGDKYKVIKDFGLFGVSFLGALAAVLGGVNLLNNEIKRKTIYNILSKPVSRFQFVIGKFLGLSLTTAILVSLMGICLVIFILLVEGRIDYLLFQAIYIAILESIIICAVTIFFSCMVVTTVLTGFFGFAFYLGGRAIGYLQYFINDEKTPVGLKNTVKVFDAILPDLSIYNVADMVVEGVAISRAHFMTATMYCLLYCATAIILACLIFDRRELSSK